MIKEVLQMYTCYGYDFWDFEGNRRTLYGVDYNDALLNAPKDFDFDAWEWDGLSYPAYDVITAW